MVVGASFAKHLDAPFVFQTRQFRHQEILFLTAHVAIVDIEGEAGGMRRRITENRVSIYLPQVVLVLLGPNERANRKWASKLIVIRLRQFLENPERLRSDGAKHTHLQRVAIRCVAEVE